MKSTRQKEKSAAPAKWLVQRFAFCTLGGACSLYLCFNLPLLKGKAIVVPGKATPINFSITPHQLPFGGAGTFPHSRRGLQSKVQLTAPTGLFALRHSLPTGLLIFLFC